MGMYDWVEYSCKCPKCGTKVDGFQTKSGPSMLKVLKVGEVDNFYSSCEKCGTWVEYTLKPDSKHLYSIDDYTMSTENPLASDDDADDFEEPMDTQR